MESGDNTTPPDVTLKRTRDRWLQCPQCGKTDKVRMKHAEIGHRRNGEKTHSSARCTLVCKTCESETDIGFDETQGRDGIRLTVDQPARKPDPDEKDTAKDYKGMIGLNWVRLKADAKNHLRCPWCGQTNGITLMEQFARPQRIASTTLHTLTIQTYCYGCDTHVEIGLQDYEGTRIIMQIRRS